MDGDGAVFAAGTLDGVTYRGALFVASFHFPIGSLTVAHGITFTGASGTGFGSVTVGPGTQFIVRGNTTLDNATITLVGGGPPPNVPGNSIVIATLDGSYLTLGRDLLLADGNPGQQDGVPGGVVNTTNLVNGGEIEADQAGGLLAVNAGRFLNLGLLSVSNGDQLYLNTTQWANVVGGTLHSGTYFVGAGSVLAAPSSVTITTLAATLTLSGAGSELKTFDSYTDPNDDPLSTTPVLLEATLTTIAAGGALRLLAGRGFAATHAVTDDGLLFIVGGTFGANPGLTIGAAGTLLGAGFIAAPIANAGTIESNGGVLTLAGGVTDDGTLIVDAGSITRLPAAVTEGTIVVKGTLDSLGAPVSASSISIAIGGVARGMGLITGALTDSGTLEADGGLLTVVGPISGGGAARIDAGSKLHVEGDATFGALTDAGILQLDGAAIATGSAAITASGRVEGHGALLGSISNAGTIEAIDGLLRLGAISGAGALRIGAGATLELLAASANDVAFASGVGTLALDAPTAFASVIRDLSAGDTLMFKNDLIGSATILPGATLEMVGSFGTLDYRIAGALANATFTVSANHHDITLVHV